ncbi:hypothetical protein [Variovorax sp. PvP013]|uniref:hypothetical protein n=1 Tax=Variovorax sp. PvP013 TaxID=3156435 RepID=UPI003D1A3FA6
MADRLAVEPSKPAGRSPVAGQDASGRLVVRFHDGETMRGRSVGGIVRSGVVDVPAPPTRLVADWTREIATNLRLEPGDVEPLSLPRARMRWPDFRRCVQAASDWMGTLGLPDVLATGEIALMACRGARHHHDAAQYGGSVFCNLFLSEDRGLEVRFPMASRRIALTRGTMLLFDTGQPHAVVPRGADRFDAADFASGRDRDQVFLTWELPIGDPRVAEVLGIVVDDVAPTGIEEEGLRWDGAPARLCPASGRLLRGRDPDPDQAIT